LQNQCYYARTKLGHVLLRKNTNFLLTRQTQFGCVRSLPEAAGQELEHLIAVTPFFSAFEALTGFSVREPRMRGGGQRDFRMRREPCHCLRPAPLFAFFIERGFFLVSGAYAQQGRGAG
jgi:hypothetical protein